MSERDDALDLQEFPTGDRPLAYAVAASGVLAWLAVLAVGVALAEAIVAPRPGRGASRPA